MTTLNIFEAAEKALQNRISAKAATLASQAIWDAQSRTGLQLTKEQIDAVVANKKAELETKAVEAILSIVLAEVNK